MPVNSSTPELTVATLPDRGPVIAARETPAAAGGPWQSAAAEQRLAAAEQAQDARALAERARDLRIARQRERAALDGIAIRLLALLRTGDQAPARPTLLRPRQDEAVTRTERIAA
jgi:hypothetical protein